MEDHDGEEGIQKQNDIVLDGRGIEHHRSRIGTDLVGDDCGLNHDQAVGDGLFE